MSNNMMIAIFGLIGAFVGIVPGILTLVMNWLRNRDNVSRTLRELELAKSELEFLDRWLALADKLEQDEQVLAEQQRAKARLLSLVSKLEFSYSGLGLALTSVPSPKRQRKKVAFYSYSGFLGFILLGSTINDDGEFDWDYFLNEIQGDGTTALIFFGIIWVWLLLRFLRSARP